MTKEIEAIYEGGIIRPVGPLGLPEETRLDVIVITNEKPRSKGNAAEILAEPRCRSKRHPIPFPGESMTRFST